MMAKEKGWRKLKSGVQNQGDWYMGPYVTGWWLWNKRQETFGPFANEGAALKAWEKRTR